MAIAETGDLSNEKPKGSVAGLGAAKVREESSPSAYDVDPGS